MRREREYYETSQDDIASTFALNAPRPLETHTWENQREILAAKNRERCAAASHALLLDYYLANAFRDRARIHNISHIICRTMNWTPAFALLHAAKERARQQGRYAAQIKSISVPRLQD